MPGDMLLFWSALNADGVTNKALRFNSVQPVARFQTEYQWRGRNLFFIFPQAIIQAGQQVALYALARFPGNSTQRFISRLLFNENTGFGTFTRKVTNSRGMGGTTEVEAGTDSEQFGELEPITFASADVGEADPELEGGLFDPELRQQILRKRLLPAGSSGLESIFLPSTDAYLAKLLWLEKSEAGYAIKVADLNEVMEIVPGSEVTVAEAGDLMLSDMAAVVTNDGERMIIAWSEHQSDGTTRLLVTKLEL